MRFAWLIVALFLVGCSGSVEISSSPELEAADPGWPIRQVARGGFMSFRVVTDPRTGGEYLAAMYFGGGDPALQFVRGSCDADAVSVGTTDSLPDCKSGTPQQEDISGE
jgi:hypothetical protein